MSQGTQGTGDGWSANTHTWLATVAQSGLFTALGAAALAFLHSYQPTANTAADLAAQQAIPALVKALENAQKQPAPAITRPAGLTDAEWQTILDLRAKGNK